MKLGLSLGLGRPSARRFPANIQPFAWYDFTDASSLTLSGSDITNVRDKSGKNYHLNAPSSPPSFDGSKAIFDHVGVEYLQSIDLASTWNFLHDSNQSTVICIARVTRAANNFLLGTQGSTSTGRGMNIIAQTYSDLGRRLMNIGNGSALVRAANTTNYLLPLNTTGIEVFSKNVSDVDYYDFKGFANGEMAMATNDAQPVSDDDAENTLFIGKYPDSTSSPLGGEIFEILIYDRQLDLPQIEAIEHYAAQKYGITLYIKTVAPLIFLNGQSNARGADLITNASNFSASQVITDAKIFNPSSSNNYVDLEIGSNNATGLTDTPTIIGPEGGLMEQAVSSVGGRVNVIKYTVGGTDIAQFLPGGSEYDTTIQRYRRAIERLIQEGFKPEIYWAFWQGESDADDETRAGNYADNLEALYQQYVDNSLGLGIQQSAIVQIQPTAMGYDYLTTVQNAQSAFVSGKTNATLIDRSQTLLGDGIHATADSSELVGNDIADAFFA